VLIAECEVLSGEEKSGQWQVVAPSPVDGIIRPFSLLTSHSTCTSHLALFVRFNECRREEGDQQLVMPRE
jgi:hypothetical protein